jgi:hypothetical protein
MQFFVLGLNSRYNKTCRNYILLALFLLLILWRVLSVLSAYAAVSPASWTAAFIVVRLTNPEYLRVGM